MAVYELTVTQALTINQSTGSNPFGRSIQQTLVVNQSIKVMPHSEGMTHTLAIGQTIAVRKSINHITVSQYLPFYQQGAKGPELQSILQHFDMWQEARLVKTGDVVDTLTINQSISVEVAKNATNTLVITQTITCNVIRNRVCTQTFVIQQGAGAYLSDEETYSIPIPAFSGPNAPEC